VISINKHYKPIRLAILLPTVNAFTNGLRRTRNNKMGFFMD